MSRIRIERIDLRLRRSSQHRAAELALELRRGLLPAIDAELRAGPMPAGGARVVRADVPPVRVPGGAPGSRTAAAVGRAVAARLRAVGGERSG